MRKLILPILAIAFIACNKSKNPPVTPNTPTPNTPTSTNAKFIPNWYDNDTLYGVVSSTSSWDTIITKTVKDTSFIIYQGKQYYIWKEPIAASDTFINDQRQYSYIIISPTKDIKDAISKSMLNSVLPYKYKDANGQWQTQWQTLNINDLTNFKPVSMGSYVSIRKH